VSHAPPVGSYDVTKGSDSGTGPVTFDQGSRFAEKKDQTPGPADTQPNIVTSLNCSNASLNSTGVFVTPSKPIKHNTRQKSSSTADLSSKESLSHQIHHLQYKVSELEKNLQRASKEKLTAEKSLKMAWKEKDELVNKLEELQADGGVSVQQIQAELESCQKDLSILKQENIELCCQKGNLEADLELGKQSGNALAEQMSYLETQRNELISQIAELNGTISHFQVILDQVRYDKRVSDEDVLSLKAQLKESQSTSATLKDDLSKREADIARLEQDIESQRCQTEDVQISLTQLEKRYEEIYKERRSFEDNCFNLERAKEILEEQKNQLNEDLMKIRNEKAEVEEQMKILEDTTTESLRGITVKYEALENSNAAMIEEFERREALLRSELEVTKQSYESVKDDLDVMKTTYAALRHDYDAISVVASELEQKLEGAKLAEMKIKQENEEMRKLAEENALENEREKEKLLASIQKFQRDLESNETKLTSQGDEISNLKSLLSQTEDENELLFSKLDRLNEDVDERNEKIKELNNEMQRELSVKEESITRITEELGRRVVEVQTKLATSEHNFKSTLELEQKKYNQLSEEYERLKSDETIEAFRNEAKMWQSKYEELESKVRPFQAQLELFEQEKFALMSENNWKESEIAKLAERYAQILGHQNNKQKIHHIVKIKEENLSLKKEVSKLRSQMNREKHSKNSKANSPKITKKSRFDPGRASQHGGKENDISKPLTELTDSDLNATVN